ncbi:hypothetical protein D9611_014180 [Ephemerocybe angulata]|uniref:Uncharacterized protein n=1 Tax=Ephemerocybe angulata TaxID=980116 RepID=A0A8H5CC63_9AGAR|nr:hypothetical protein D9611_014180 [Tulosesus angulatus]
MSDLRASMLVTITDVCSAVYSLMKRAVPMQNYDGGGEERRRDMDTQRNANPRLLKYDHEDRGNRSRRSVFKRRTFDDSSINYIETPRVCPARLDALSSLGLDDLGGVECRGIEPSSAGAVARFDDFRACGRLHDPRAIDVLADSPGAPTGLGAWIPHADFASEASSALRSRVVDVRGVGCRILSLREAESEASFNGFRTAGMHCDARAMCVGAAVAIGRSLVSVDRLEASLSLVSLANSAVVVVGDDLRVWGAGIEP